MAEGVNQAAQGAAGVVEAVAEAGSAAGAAVGQAVPGYSFGGYFMGLSLMFIMLGILWFGARYIKKKGGLRFLGQTPDLNIESRLSLGPRKNLLVLNYRGKRLLLGVTEHHISLLSEDNLAEDAAAGAEGLKNSGGRCGQKTNGACTTKPADSGNGENSTKKSDESVILLAKNTRHSEHGLAGKFKDMLHDLNKRQ